MERKRKWHTVVLAALAAITGVAVDTGLLGGAAADGVRAILGGLTLIL